MPGSPPVSKSSAEHGETTNAHLNVDRDDVTPRSEVPVSVKVMAPSLSEETATVTDYFAPDPNASETSSQHAPSSPSTTRLSSTTAASHATATGTIVPETSYTSTPERPVPQRDISNVTSASVQSTDSAATITPATANLASIVEARPRPAYPDQSFAALQGFQYPHRGGHLPALRQRSSNPSNASQILTFSSALASMHQTGSRTAGNSPAPTPGGGLFSPSVPTSAREEWESPETPGTYASPFLHFTHRQAPKETHVADVDVDPISGRKLINHYEIIDELGRGAHGKVKLGRDLQTHDTHVAIKIVERYSTRRRLGKIGNAQDKVKKEIAILKKARHPNVVALLEVIDDPSRKKVYIVLEWVERGEIQWRAGAPKEIAMIEARRYERERRAIHDPNLDAVDVAVTTEAQKRLRRKKRTQLRTFRKLRQEASANPAIWSHEMHGDDDSEESDDDRLSRVSTGTAESTPMEHSLTRLLTGSGRRASRTPSPLPPIPQGFDKDLEQFLALTEERQVEEPDTMTPSTPTGGPAPSPWTGLEGTMYGAYDPSSGEPSRESSMNNSVHSFPPSRQASLSAEELMRLANEALECDLNSELQYVPCMTMYNVRVAFRDTLLGLQYLHAQGIVHRDIKPPNLLQTTDGRVKISDFGVSYLGRPLHGDDAGEDVSESEARDLDDEAKELAKTVGTPAFFAPELCITEVLDDPPPITKAIDVWALGITLFCMIYARTPYVDNEFVVMRMVADEDIYIPRRRLLPINQKSQSRPSSHSRTIPTIHAGRRHELDMMYEDIDDDLYDLLKRLLIKDPRKRITLEEVRHHPWVVADLSNRMSWLEETDPALPNQGKKIEVSNEDVNTAVVPLQWVERVRSGIKKVGERLGFSTKTVRGRSGSSVGMSGPGGSPVPSAHSSSSTISQDARRQSVRGDESIFSALKASKEGSEHPLSKSVAASPDFERGKEYFDGKPPRPESVASVLEESDERPRTRPSPPERSKTLMSTAGSVRTLRQSDFKHSLVKESPPPSPGLPGTPTALDSPGGSNLGGLLGGAGRRILKTVRERSAARSVAPDLRGRSKDRSSVESFDMHGGPSLAISQTLVAGRVNQPDVLRDATPASSANNSARNSPSASRAHSVVASPQHLKPSGAGALSRQSSLSSIASASRVSTSYSNHDETPIKQQSRIVPPESTAEDWQRASDERLRKLIREGEETSRPTSSFDDRTCPPSPDDHERRRGDSRRVSAFDISQPISSLETSPTGHGNQLPPSLVSSSSDFGSAVSMSISNPSIPSVISEASSIDPIEGVAPDDMGAKSVMDSDDTINSKQPTFSTQLVEDEEGYSPDHDETALDSEEENEYESSSESDGGLIMQRRKSATKPLYSSSPRNGGLSAALETAQLKQRRGTGVSRSSRKSSRSGSNNTMKKVWTRDSEDERQRMDITEE